MEVLQGRGTLVALGLLNDFILPKKELLRRGSKFHKGSISHLVEVSLDNLVALVLLGITSANALLMLHSN